MDGDEILVATGRQAPTRDLGVEIAGLTPGDTIDVDDTMQVPGVPWLYAIGDVNGRSLLTHAGKYQAHVVSEILAGRRSEGITDRGGVPQVIFTEPQIAAVGLTLQDALDRGPRRPRLRRRPRRSTAGASFHGRDTPGTSRIVVDEGRGLIVGATFVGSEVAEWLHAASIAIVAEMPIERLWEAIPAFPTRSEVWLKLLEAREAQRAAEPQLTAAAH